MMFFDFILYIIIYDFKFTLIFVIELFLIIIMIICIFLLFFHDLNFLFKEYEFTMIIFRTLIQTIRLILLGMKSKISNNQKENFENKFSLGTGSIGQSHISSFQSRYL